MKVIWNRVKEEFPDSLNLYEALEAMQIGSHKGLAIAVNSKVIPKQDWTQVVLRENDEVILVRASQGG